MINSLTNLYSPLFLECLGIILFLLLIFIFLYLVFLSSRKYRSEERNFVLKIPKELQKELERILHEGIRENINLMKGLIQKEIQESLFQSKKEFAGLEKQLKSLAPKIEGELLKEVDKAKEKIKSLEQETQEISKITLKARMEAQNKMEEEILKNINQLNAQAKKEFLEIRKKTNETINELTKESKKHLEEFIKNLKLELVDLKKVEDEVLKYYVENTKKELENYKQQKIKEVDQNIYKIIEKVIKNTTGKLINVSEHQELVIKALEKAKKEGIFTE